MATKKYVSDSKLQYFWNKIKSYITNVVSGKQDVLTAGDNINISNNTISANFDIENADWSENDTTSKAYVENRTHYEEDPITTEVWTYNGTAPSIDEPYTVEIFDGEIGNIKSEYKWVSQIKEGVSYVINFNETLYTNTFRTYLIEGTTILYAGNPHIATNSEEDTGEPFFIGFVLDSNSSVLIRFALMTSITDASNINITLSLNIDNIHKLDSKYLNGSLILSGEGISSEIFNGESSTLRYPISISGKAGSISYTFYSPKYLQSLKYFFDKVTIENHKDIKIMNYSFDDSSSMATLTLSETLNENIDINDENLALYIPNKIAFGLFSHVEGVSGWACGSGTHTEGGSTSALGEVSHAEGGYTLASGDNSHAEGFYTAAQGRSQHVFGEYNVLDNNDARYNRGNYVEIVGNGTSDSERSNARTLDWSGNEVLKGKLTVGSAPTENMDVATKQYVDEASSGQLYATDNDSGTVTLHFGTSS